MKDLFIDEYIEMYKGFEINITQTNVCIFDNSKNEREHLQVVFENLYNVLEHCISDCKNMIDYFLEFGSW